MNLSGPLTCLMLTWGYPSVESLTFCGPPHISRTCELTYVDIVFTVFVLQQAFRFREDRKRLEHEAFQKR